MLVEEEGKGGGRNGGIHMKKERRAGVKKEEVEKEGKIKTEGKRDRRETSRGLIGV